MVFLGKRLLDTLMQIFIMLQHLVVEILRFNFDDYREIRTGASDLTFFGRCIYSTSDSLSLLWNLPLELILAIAE